MARSPESKRLGEWFNSGAEERLGHLADAEKRLTTAVKRAVSTPTPDSRDASTAAADEVLAAAKEALEWLEIHTSADWEVDHQFRLVMSAYRQAAEILIGMGEDPSLMTEAEGKKAAAAIAVAQRANYDLAVAFAGIVNPGGPLPDPFTL